MGKPAFMMESQIGRSDFGSLPRVGIPTVLAKAPSSKITLFVPFVGAMTTRYTQVLKCSLMDLCI